MKVKNESEVAQSGLTLSDPMDCSLLGSSIHRIFQARVTEWGAIAFSVSYMKHTINRDPYFLTTIILSSSYQAMVATRNDTDGVLGCLFINTGL